MLFLEKTQMIIHSLTHSFIPLSCQDSDDGKAHFLTQRQKHRDEQAAQFRCFKGCTDTQTIFKWPLVFCFVFLPLMETAKCDIMQERGSNCRQAHTKSSPLLPKQALIHVLRFQNVFVRGGSRLRGSPTIPHVLHITHEWLNTVKSRL